MASEGHACCNTIEERKTRLESALRFLEWSRKTTDENRTGDTFIGCFVGAFVGSPQRAENREVNPQPSCVGGLVGAHVRPLMWPLVGQISRLLCASAKGGCQKGFDPCTEISSKKSFPERGHIRQNRPFTKQLITIRNARITILIPLEYFDVMDMKSLQKIIPPEFSDVMIASIVGGDARDANPTNYEK